MNLRFLLALFCLLISILVTAQSFDKESNRVLPPSPTAASLGKYGEIPVSMYTGTPSISIPVYTVQAGELSVPVSLSYHSGSVKPNEIPGWVGLGWSLLAGGVITRTVRDIPDDSDGFSGGSGTGFYYDIISPTAKFPGVYNSIVTTPLPPTTVQFFWDNEGRQNDTKPDDFSFNFGGYSGQFFFGQDGKIHMRSQQPLMISFDIDPATFTGVLSSISHHIGKWTITTGDGIKYIFEHKEMSYMELSGSAMAAYISSWYLSKIESPSGQFIELEYSEADGKVRVKESQTQKIGYVNPAGSGMGIIDISQNSRSVSMDEVIYLKKIKFPNGYLQFNTVPRNDPQYTPSGYSGITIQEQKLNEISLYETRGASAQKLLSWNLGYTEVNRLKLTSITKLGENNPEGEVTSMEYDSKTFDGNTGNANYPNPYDQNAIDHWGFYNASNAASKIPVTPNPSNPTNNLGHANRATVGAYANTSMLEKITWPTGGYTTFEFEPNDYGAVTIPSPYPDPSPAWWPLADYHISGPSYAGSYECPGNPESVTFTLNAPTLVKKFINEKWVHNDIVPCNTEYITTVLDENVMLPAGTYNLNDVFNNRILNDCAALPTGPIPGNAPANCLEYIRYGVAVPYVPGQTGGGQGGIETGGARIKKISSFDGQKTTLTKTYSYRTGNKSSGILNKMPVYIIPDLSIYGTAGGFALASYPVGSMPSGSHIGYGEVTEILGDGSSTVNFFTTYDVHGDGGAYELADHGFGPMISNEMWRGLLTGTRIYNNTGNLLKSTDIEYYLNLNEYMGRMVDNTWIFMATGDGGPEGVGAISKSMIPSRFVAKKLEIERVYNPIDHTKFLEKQTDYIYNLANLQVKEVKTTNSKNEKILSETKYAVDFSGGVFDQMKSQNLILFPIEQKTSKELPLKELTLNRSDYEMLPLTSLIKMRKNSSSILGNALETNTTFDRYDDQGNLLQISRRNAPVTSYLWGYEKMFPVAEVQNASADDIAYSSFETSENGNWNLSDLARVTDQALTGRQAYKLVSGTPVTKTNLSASKKYIVSYWSKNGAAAVAGVTGTAVISKNGWTCYLHNLPVSTTSVSITGNNIVIDELRLYPVGAMMSTVAYDPLIGVTTQCDAKNNVTYYEYNHLLRLLRIRDADRNILKQFDYKLKVPSHTNPVWELTGITRCKPCAANSNYVLNISQKQEKDVNPASTSYNQIRWIDGPAGTCVITADWQNTATAIRCKKTSANTNTGEQEREQQDMNPCSPTYNQTRWIVTGTNLTACALPKPYARITVENYQSSGNNTLADVVVRFYADENMTIPMSVHNVVLGYREDVHGSLCGCTISTNNFTINCTGDEVIILSQTPVMIEQHGPGEVDYIETWYTILAGAGYHIIN